MFDVSKLGMLTLTFIYWVICVCFASYGHVGCQSVMIRKHDLQLVCLEFPLCMPKSVNIGKIHHNTKNMLCGCHGDSPPVDLVIPGTNWCQCTDTDEELHLSSTDGDSTWHAYIY